MSGPPDAFSAPRYTGVRTFARCPHERPASGADVAVAGIPFDTGTSFRPGARFGPGAIREASLLLRPYHPPLDVDVFTGRTVVDWGDIAVTPGNAERSVGQVASGIEEVLSAGAVPIVLGGDHTVALGELRAHAAAHGPVGVVLLDAHADTWDAYYGERYFHGTVFRRAVEEGLVLPERSLLAGMRGSLYGPEDLDAARALGFEILPCDELRELSPAAYSQRVRARVGDAPAFLGFDIDVVDPAFAPATGTPEVAGLTPHEALAFVRELAGIPFVGYDVVEVAPAYDGPGQVTALLAANVAYEMLALSAVAGR